MKGTDEEIEAIEGAHRVLVSYDVKRYQHGENVKIHQYIFGRRVTAKLSNGSKKRYRYDGILERTDAEHIGQSVLMMREKDADEFVSFLHGLRISCMVWHVWIKP